MKPGNAFKTFVYEKRWTTLEVLGVAITYNLLKDGLFMQMAFFTLFMGAISVVFDIFYTKKSKGDE